MSHWVNPHPCSWGPNVVQCRSGGSAKPLSLPCLEYSMYNMILGTRSILSTSLKRRLLFGKIDKIHGRRNHQNSLKDQITKEFFKIFIRMLVEKLLWQIHEKTCEFFNNFNQNSVWKCSCSWLRNSYEILIRIPADSFQCKVSCLNLIRFICKFFYLKLTFGVERDGQRWI